MSMSIKNGSSEFDFIINMAIGEMCINISVVVSTIRKISKAILARNTLG